MKNTILVVDDDRELTELLSSLLKKNGYEVRVEYSGKGALNAVERECPNLILLDINLPDMDGFSVSLQLKTDEATKDIPIIMLTGRKDSESISRSFDLESADYIMKPFDNQTLLDKVKRLLPLEDGLPKEEIS